MLQIGRRLYFDKQGILILDTGERMGSVMETTIQEDFAVYSQLEGLSEADAQVVNLSYGERSEEFLNMGSVRFENNELIFYPKLIITSDKTQINSDGIDFATITANIADYYSINGEGQYFVNPLEFSSQLIGTYFITAHSEINGNNSIMIEVV